MRTLTDRKSEGRGLATKSVAQERLSALLMLTKLIKYPSRSTNPSQWSGTYHEIIMQADEGIEQRRQKLLAEKTLTDSSVLEEIHSILLEFPTLAAFKYKNIFGNDFYPLCYLVLSGAALELVRNVHNMYPLAISEPLNEVQDGAKYYGHHHGESDNEPKRRKIRKAKVFSLLNAACAASPNVSDDVILFVAKSCPEAIPIRYHDKPLPFMERIIFRVRHNGSNLASKELVQALTPRNSWSLGLLSDLFALAYDAETLHLAVDMLILHGKKPEKPGGINRKQYFGFSGGLSVLDLSRAQVLDRLLCLTSLGGEDIPVAIRHFQLTPAKFTREGMIHTVHCLMRYTTLRCLGVKISSNSLILGDDDFSQDHFLSLLEEVFTTNNSIEELKLEVPSSYFMSISRGLAKRKCQTLRKLKFSSISLPEISSLETLLAAEALSMELTLENIQLKGHWSTAFQAKRSLLMLKDCELTPELLVQTVDVLPLVSRPKCLTVGDAYASSQSSDSVEIIGACVRILDQGFLEELNILDPPSTIAFEETALISSLHRNTTLRRLEVGIAPDSQAKEQQLLKLLLDLMAANTTLTQLVVYDKDKRVDFTGFSKYSQEMRQQSIHSSSFKIADEKLASQMVYFMMLNKYGRRQARSEGTTRAAFVELIAKVTSDPLLQDRRSVEPNVRGKSTGTGPPYGITDVSVLNGLLHACEPCRWASSAIDRSVTESLEKSSRPSHAVCDEWIVRLRSGL